MSDGVGVAGALTTSGTSGIVVAAGAGDAVNLRGLTFNGFNASGASGVVFNSGAQLHIEQCVFLGFATSGVTFSPGAGSAATAAMAVENTTIINNAIGMLIKPSGGIAANVSLSRVKIDNNSGGGLRPMGREARARSTSPLPTAPRASMPATASPRPAAQAA